MRLWLVCFGVGLASVAAIASWSSPAKAEGKYPGLMRAGLWSNDTSPPSSNGDAPPVPSFGHHHRLYNFKFNTDAGFLRVEAFSTGTSVPSLAVNGSDAPRRLVGVPTPSGSARLYGGSVAFELRADALTFAIFEVRYATSGAGPAGETNAFASGSAVGVQRDAVNLVQIGLPTLGIPSGVQLMSPKSSFKVRFDFLDWAVSHIWTDAHLTDSTGARASGTASAWSAYLEWSLALCGSPGRWADPLRSWGCVFARATLYDGNTGAMSAMTLGARVEL